MATLSSKNQIVIPREAREALRLKAGDKLQVVVKGREVIVFRKPSSEHKALLGLMRDVYPSSYLANERESWE